MSGSADAALFDLGQAYELYEALLGPVEALIKDKPQLIVVPSGPLTGLPMHLLVTEKPSVASRPSQPCSLSRCGLAAEASRHLRAALGRQP